MKPTIPCSLLYPDNRFATHARWVPIDGGWVLEHSRTEKDEQGEPVTVWRRSRCVVMEDEE